MRKLLTIECLEDRTLLSLFTVTNTGDSGAGSLRQAILDANANGGADTIAFNIADSDPGFVDVDSALPGGDAAADAFVIQPLSALPALGDATGGTTVDSRTQTAFGGDTNPFGPEIVLDGSLAGNANGLNILSDYNAVIGLNIQSFGADGIEINGGDSNWITGNALGTDATGTIDRGNGFTGIHLRNGAQFNVIGSNGDGLGDANEGNLISGNANQGVLLGSGNANNNVVAGNLIGTDRTGTSSVGNGTMGVQIFIGASFNRVGTNADGVADAAERNIISGNVSDGIRLDNPATQGNVIAGNYIGTDVTGTAAVPNVAGMRLRNAVQGTRIGTDGDGVHDEAERNVVSGNTTHGIIITDGSTLTVVAGNYIGTEATGSAALGNGGIGVFIQTFQGNGSPLNRIGTNGDGLADPAERNLISGNFGDGVQIAGAGTDHNVVAGNYIGTDVTGTAALGNTGGGVAIAGGATNNRIGTNGDGMADDAERNVISGNGKNGVGITGSGTDQNVVAGNYIGTDKTGLVTLGNVADGIVIGFGAQFNLVGTDGDGVADAAERNIISGNNVPGGEAGILIIDADNNAVAGNYIGTDVTGAIAIPNARNGIKIRLGSEFNRIGTNGDGTGDAAEGNVISGNQLRGVLIGFDAGNDHNTIAGNFIGTDATGTVALGNAGLGIHITGGSQSNVIGTNGDGVNDAAERNVISANGNDGVALTGGGTDSNVIAGNLIGTDVTGTQPLGNGALVASDDGVSLRFGPQFNRIGTNGDGVSDALERNVISANTGAGILILDPGTNNNIVAGNFIGTDITGTVALGNNTGVNIGSASQGNQIGTDGDGVNDAAEANTIAFNVGAGVSVLDGTTTGNSIRGNSIHSNGGLGIDLGGDGVTPNDALPEVIGPTALDFDGTSDFVEVNTDLSPQAETGAITLSAWVFVRDVNTDAGGQTRQPIIAKGFFGEWEYALYVYDSLQVGISLWQNSGASHSEPTGGLLTLNKWHHVAGTYERDGSTNVYLDGELVASNSARNGEPGNGTRPIRIGSREDNQFLNAAIDEVRIYDRALTHAEIQATMNEALFGNEPRLLASWRFNEGSGDTVFDQTAGHHDGTLGAGVAADQPVWVVASDTVASDPDTGPNNLQNFPVLALAEAGPATHVIGALNSTPNTLLTIDVYASGAADPSGHGEGERYLGSFTVTTDASGDATIDTWLAASTIAGEAVSATATDPPGNTSEFSQVASAMETFDSIAVIVEDLLTRGSINDGQEESITALLDNAAAKLESGSTTAAANQLNATIHHIESLVEDGVLTAEEGQALIDAVNNLLGQISSNGSALYLDDGQQKPVAQAAGLTQTALEKVWNPAIAYWSVRAVPGRDWSGLTDATVHVADLPATMLGYASPAGIIWVDRDAAGYGWSLGRALQSDRSSATGSVDLLSVVAHEIGHLLGLEHSGVDAVMGGTLAPGEDRLAGQIAGDEVTVGFHAADLLRRTIDLLSDQVQGDGDGDAFVLDEALASFARELEQGLRASARAGMGSIAAHEEPLSPWTLTDLGDQEHLLLDESLLTELAQHA